MSTLPTLPIPRPHATAQPHEHAWATESRHSTSEGTVLYVACTGCGARRIDVQAHPQGPPAALSRAVGPLTP